MCNVSQVLSHSANGKGGQFSAAWVEFIEVFPSCSSLPQPRRATIKCISIWILEDSMNKNSRGRFTILIAAILCLSFSVAYAQQKGKKEFVFKGKVEEIDAKGQTLTITNEKIDGWMSAMK